MPARATCPRARGSVPEIITATGPLVGQMARSTAAPPLLTCEAVIAETAWQLASSTEAVDRLYGLVEAGALRIVDLLPEHMSHIRALADCIGLRVMRSLAGRCSTQAGNPNRLSRPLEPHDADFFRRVIHPPCHDQVVV